MEPLSVKSLQEAIREWEKIAPDPPLEVYAASDVFKKIAEARAIDIALTPEFAGIADGRLGIMEVLSFPAGVFVVRYRKYVKYYRPGGPKEGVKISGNAFALEVNS